MRKRQYRLRRADAGKLVADMVIAEYSFVENLIPFYRRIEATALGATVESVR